MDRSLHKLIQPKSRTCSKSNHLDEQHQHQQKKKIVDEQPEEEGEKDEEKYNLSQESFYLHRTPYECILKARELIKKCIESETINKKSIYDMTKEDITLYIHHRVLYQIDAAEDVAKTLRMAMRSVPTSPEDNKPFKFFLNGTIGVGKTEMVKVVKTLLRMNDVHKDAFIEYRFGGINQNNQATVLTGASPGYIGFTDKTSLYHLLTKASAYYRNVPEEGLFKPHLILLFIDELDKANKDIMNNLNSLLSDGVVSGDGNRIYRVPVNTRLIIAMTANFGSNAIIRCNANADEHYDIAKCWVTREMEMRDYKDCDIDRVGVIIPLFPATKENLVIILIKRMYNKLANVDAFSTKYGHPKISNKALIQFVESLIKDYTVSKGIRHICDTLDREVNSFLDKNLEHFDNSIAKNMKIPLVIPPTIGFDVIPYDEETKETFIQSSPILSMFAKDRSTLRSIKKSLVSGQDIQYLSMNHPAIATPGINVLSPHLTIIINNHNHYGEGNHHTDPLFLEKFEKVVQDNTQMVQKMKMIKGLIDTEDIDDKTKKKICNVMDNIPINEGVDNVDHKQLKRKKATNHVDDHLLQPSKKRKHNNYHHKKESDSNANMDLESKRKCSKCFVWLELRKFLTVIKRKKNGVVTEEYEHYRSYCNSCRNSKYKDC
jgi:hypothetical protein